MLGADMKGSIYFHVSCVLTPVRPSKCVLSKPEGIKVFKFKSLPYPVILHHPRKENHVLEDLHPKLLAGPLDFVDCSK